eukprot:GHVU01050186.1.p1 GENE.GHVU01050186.1~~GHVU01050186.1.p1  ORF type:complete len:108 (-),score=1.16 GHVU01050186.1:1653-1976(-)
MQSCREIRFKLRCSDSGGVPNQAVLPYSYPIEFSLSEPLIVNNRNAVCLKIICPLPRLRGARMPDLLTIEAQQANQNEWHHYLTRNHKRVAFSPEPPTSIAHFLADR